MEPAEPPPGTIVLTADDGYASQVAYLRTVPRELGVPWSVFLIVERMGGQKVTIGSHGMAHRNWTRMAVAAQEALRA